MENSNIDIKPNRNGRVWTGLILLLIGLVFFLRNMGYYLPDWLFSWSAFLIVLGLLIGFKRNFQGGGWIAMVLIGAYYTLDNITDAGLSKYAFAVVLTVLGLFLILTPKKSSLNGRRNAWRGRRNRLGNTAGAAEGENTANDFVDSVNVFSGTHLNVFSKDFKGGEVVALFGGCDLNLIQADFEGTIILDVVAMFGGIKIIVPPSWKVKSEVTAIFGGLEDKTSISPYQGESNKMIILKGTAIFGGVEIRNF